MTRTQSIWLVIALTLLGFTLRVYRLDYLSLRGDEANTVRTWISQPLIETLNSDIVIRDPQPPLAYAIYRGWKLFFGDVSEFGIRLLPALINTIGVPAMYALAKRFDSQRFRHSRCVSLGGSPILDLARSGCQKLCDLGCI